MDTGDNVIALRDVRFSWPAQADPVIDISSFNLQRGEKLFLHGASGSGKSTLLSLIAGILQPQSGMVSVDGIDVTTLKGAAVDRFRADHIGLVFQQFNLLPFLSVLDNVTLPCRFSRQRRQQASAQGSTLQQEASRLLHAMQLPSTLHASRSAMQLSVGQQQRVAVARALMGRPSLVIADEPTSSLDTDTRTAFLQLLFTELEESGASLLFVSHDASLQSLFDRSLPLSEVNASGTLPMTEPG